MLKGNHITKRCPPPALTQNTIPTSNTTGGCLFLFYNEFLYQFSSKKFRVAHMVPLAYMFPPISIFSKKSYVKLRLKEDKKSCKSLTNFMRSGDLNPSFPSPNLTF